MRKTYEVFWKMSDGSVRRDYVQARSIAEAKNLSTKQPHKLALYPYRKKLLKARAVPATKPYVVEIQPDGTVERKDNMLNKIVDAIKKLI